MRKFPITLRALQRTGVALGLLGTALAGSVVTSSPASAGVEPDWQYADSWTYDGDTGFGDLPDCGADNIDGHDNTASATWRVFSTLAPGTEVEPGDEWQVRGTVSGYEGGTGDNGPSPLGLRFYFTGPAVAYDIDGTFEPGPGEVVHGGDESVGSLGQVNDTEWAFDANSDPGVFEASDGVSVQIDVYFRATAEGVVDIDEFRVFGYDGTPTAGNFTCGVDLPLSNVVDVVDPPTSGADNARTDANYSFALLGDANTGPHTISIPVLNNDNDPEVAGPPGNPAEVRVHDWTAASVQGGTVSCGTQQQKNNGTFASMSQGPCLYTPPLDLPQGTNDSFTYVIRSVSGKEKSVVVNIDLVDNVKPYRGNQIIQMPGAGGDFTLTPKDVTNDPIVCDAVPAFDTTPPGHTVTVNANCSVNFGAGASGEYTFPYRACDRHTTILPPNHGAIGNQSVVETGTYDDGDFSSTQSARCSDFTATVRVPAGGAALPPNGVGDFDVVDAGYAGDGIGAYTVEIPVRMNDTDGNGVQPSDPAFTGTVAVLDGPDPSEGTASVNGDREIVFTPADGFEGPVEFTYNIGEDPTQQNPAYQPPAFAGIGTVAVFVIGNPAPVAEPDAALTNSVDDVTDLDVGANDTDAEGEALACTPGALVPTPAGIVQSASIDATCLVDITPVEGADGGATLTYEVCDDHALASPNFPAAAYGDDGRDPGDDANRCDEGDITVTVASDAEVQGGDDVNPDPDPVCAADAAVTQSGVAITVPVLANDTDTDLGGDPSPLDVDTAGTGDDEGVTAEGGTVTVPDDGADVRYTPRAGFTGNDTFEYAALDSAGQVCVATVTVRVDAVAGTSTTSTTTGVGSGSLARTGADGAGQLQVGVGLAVAGLGMVLLGRRRPERGAIS